MVAYIIVVVVEYARSPNVVETLVLDSSTVTSHFLQVKSP
jgi:hypothetical protein